MTSRRHRPSVLALRRLHNNENTGGNARPSMIRSTAASLHDIVFNTTSRRHRQLRQHQASNHDAYTEGGPAPQLTVLRQFYNNITGGNAMPSNIFGGNTGLHNAIIATPGRPFHRPITLGDRVRHRWRSDAPSVMAMLSLIVGTM